MEYYSAMKRSKPTDTCNNLDDAPENCAKWKKRASQGYILNDSTQITFSNLNVVEIENRLMSASG